MNQQFHYLQPKVPGCWCRMPGGAGVCGIIELIFCALTGIGTIYNLATGNFTGGVIQDIILLVIMTACSILVIKGAGSQCSKIFLPYIIWKPVMLFLQIAAVIYLGITGMKKWEKFANMKHDWAPGERHEATNRFKANWIFGLSFTSFYIVIGILCLYVVIQCYRHLLKSNRQMSHMPAAANYSFPGAVTTDSVYSQFGSPMTYPPPGYNEAIGPMFTENPYAGNVHTEK